MIIKQSSSEWTGMHVGKHYINRHPLTVLTIVGYMITDKIAVSAVHPHGRATPFCPQGAARLEETWCLNPRESGALNFKCMLIYGRICSAWGDVTWVLWGARHRGRCEMYLT
eukprot:TRINITY_DN21935_c0_g1_i1.p1 TRINITY_DN21935_c0_g1~~TRINITY_DN21935_c0_g1_i1.p1  ORF type:complete len:112 (+),score=3.44 TRINITY_DN21935_c0_g1_i1:65-400(+)